MNKAQKKILLTRIFYVLFAVGLGLITLILLSDSEEGQNFEHYLKLYSIALLWFILLMVALRLENVLNFKVISAKYDRLLLLIPLSLIFIILLGQFLSALVGFKIFTALLLGLVLFGLFNVISSLIASNK